LAGRVSANIATAGRRVKGAAVAGGLGLVAILTPFVAEAQEVLRVGVEIRDSTNQVVNQLVAGRNYTLYGTIQLSSIAPAANAPYGIMSIHERLSISGSGNVIISPKAATTLGIPATNDVFVSNGILHSNMAEESVSYSANYLLVDRATLYPFQVNLSANAQTKYYFVAADLVILANAIGETINIKLSDSLQDLTTFLSYTDAYTHLATFSFMVAGITNGESDGINFLGGIDGYQFYIQNPVPQNPPVHKKRIYFNFPIKFLPYMHRK
jgi:hypothetical protein